MKVSLGAAGLTGQPALLGFAGGGDGDQPELAALAHQLRATAGHGVMDPGVRSDFRQRLMHQHPARNLARSDPEAPTYWSTAVPGGTLSVAVRDGAIVYSDLTQDEPLFARECMARFGSMPKRSQPTPALARAVQRFIESGRFRGKLDLSGVPPFQQRVLLQALEIPRGEVRTYQWLAQAVGQPRAARAVGTAMAHNPIPILIPCHRVVRSDYRIGEYGCGGPAKKRELLQLEGVDLVLLERMAAGGLRFLASRTTRIFCLPVCSSARRIREENRVYLTGTEAALTAGFRPCRRCRPA
ncbi:MAG: methylated-DNA--[protein]-cysteine S-methyltransferase [Dehalococcoidia bacterium]|nr:methylated-DNA--[protein]-cysteine S-methyltransferase [Dehalococcoidia bacterium]